MSSRPPTAPLRTALRCKDGQRRAWSEPPDEELIAAAAFEAFAAALRAELAPEGALQGDLVARVALAAWRVRRSDRIEAALFARYLDGDGPRAIETLLRYRGAVLAELFRALDALKASRPRRAGWRSPGRRRCCRHWPVKPNEPERGRNPERPSTASRR